jgi:heat shock protein HslJ
MTDDQMDARLRSAGEAWRAADPAAVATAESAVPTVAAGDPHDIDLTGARRRRHRWSVLASAAAVIVLAGGAAALVANVGSGGGKHPAVESSTSDLIGTKWALVSITDSQGRDVPVAGNAGFVIDDANHLGGSDGCNSISGDVDVSGSTIGFGNGLATTEMACLDDNVMTTADHVDNMLSGDVTWSISGDQLTLTKDGTGSLVYRSTAAPTRSTDPSDLTGITWYLTTIESGTGPDGTASSVPADLTLTIDEGHIGFNDGCNGSGGPVEVGDGTLDIGNVVSTLIGCPQDGFDRELIHKVLTGKVSWEIVGDQLTITKDGVGALVYERAATLDPLSQLKYLQSVDWVLSSIDQKGNTSITSADLHSDRVRFDSSGQITISHRCYVNSGDVEIGEQALDITNVDLKTAIPCPASPEQQQEQDHAATMDGVLDGHSTWSLRSKKLAITKDDTTLVFVPAGLIGTDPETSATASDVVSPDSLTGTTWQFTAIETTTDSSGSGSGEPDSAVTFTIDGKGSYRLETGCFAYDGKATVSGSSITLSDQQSLGGDACLNVLGDQVRKFLASGTADWSIDNGQLTLGKSGTKVTFTAK